MPSTADTAPSRVAANTIAAVDPLACQPGGGLCGVVYDEACVRNEPLPDMDKDKDESEDGHLNDCAICELKRSYDAGRTA